MSTNRQTSLTDSINSVIERHFSAAPEPGLYLVSTPIGNLSDITLRALYTIACADHVLCEDTRRTSRLTSHYGLDVKLSPYHEHNAERQRPKILKWLNSGASVALLSDAGTPLISDPGYKLVREAAAAGIKIYSVPGPSAVLAGLASSGLPTDSFHFAGFLPPREAAARKRLDALSAIPATIILFDTASRLEQTLSLLAEWTPARELVIARELTKRFEEIIRAKTGEITGPRDWKGEFVVMIGPPGEQETDWRAIEDALAHAMTHASTRDAVEQIAGTFGVQRKQVYNLALDVQKKRSGGDDGK
ncbi:MAG: 16S rRNA (cytidine(1402)-2'-O)-methyltransferase [Hyphomicrobiales bacterium]|nr:16S rRNA (cytidine(1402)-2'-O)-methyltransferase [Hyphomicrobiales bacterium]